MSVSRRQTVGHSRCKGQLIATIMLLSSGIPVQAQESGESRGYVNAEALRTLMNAEAFRCQIGEGTQASWDNGTLAFERENFDVGIEYRYDSIDLEAGRARSIQVGNSRSEAEVVILATSVGLTFVRESWTGNITLTTIFAVRGATESSLYPAVWSQHFGGLLFQPIPSQLYGTCSLVE